jgi:hypothetical protein
LTSKFVMCQERSIQQQMAFFVDHQPLPDEHEAEQEGDIDEFIAAQLTVARVAPVRVFPCSPRTSVCIYPSGFSREEKESDVEDEEESPNLESNEVASSLESGYSELSQQYTTFLTTLKRPVGINTKEYREFTGDAPKFIVQDSHLFCRASKNVSSVPCC